MESVTKTDRIKLAGTANSPEEVANIFKEIEEKTKTKIQWESGKFSSTYKRDCSIRLCGSPESVKIAREMVLQNLEIQSNRVVLKMDITHEEHPSLIGKKGGLIQKVMETTNTHIHFPDMNITSTSIKSNQVSIAGEPENVEVARVMLRALIPFQVMFDIEKSNGETLNTKSPIWKHIEEKFGLETHFSEKKTSVAVTVRCSQGLFSCLRRPILYLIEFLSKKSGSDIPLVKIVMDIMPQHHTIVKGPRGSNIQAIAKRTGAKIIFPNFNFNMADRRCIYISGNLDCVYMAWHEVMSSLPICVNFDVSESRETNSDYTEFLQDCNIKVFTRPKPKYHIKSVTVKGPERFSKQIMQFRQRILNLSPIKFHPDIEDINDAFTIYSCYIDSQHSQNIKSSQVSSPTTVYTQVENLTNILNSANCFKTVENSFSNPQLTYNLALSPSVPSMEFNVSDKFSFENFEGNNVFNDVRLPSSDSYVYHAPVITNTNCPVHSSVFNSWGQNITNNNNEAVIKDSEKPFERCVSVNDNSINLDICPDSPPFKKKGANQFEIFEKRLSAHQAIHRRIESTQVPCSLWAGYGFSQSMPAAPSLYKGTVMSNQLYSCTSLESDSSGSSEENWDGIILADYIDADIWSNKEENVFSLSNVFDFKRDTCESLNSGSKDILPNLLFEFGLYNYIDVFLKEEIDYAAFLLLNEYDLIKLGINYQARMKITCLIRELQDREMKMKTFDAAPGAGRKVLEM